MRISDWSSDVCSSDLLASRRIGTQSGQDANRVAGRRQRQFSDNDSRIDLIDEMRMLNQHVARQVENTAFERAPEFLLTLIEGGAIRHTEIGRASCRERGFKYV